MIKYILIAAMQVDGHLTVTSHPFDTFEACRSAEQLLSEFRDDYKSRAYAHMACIHDNSSVPTYTDLGTDLPTKKKVEFDGEAPSTASSNDNLSTQPHSDDLPLHGN